MTDRWAGAAWLLLFAIAWIALFERFSLHAGLGVVLVLVAPFAIFLTFMRRGGLRTTRGWDRPASPPETHRDF